MYSVSILRACEVHSCSSQPALAPCEVVNARGCNAKFCHLFTVASVVPKPSVKSPCTVYIFFIVVVAVLGGELLAVCLAQYVTRRRSVVVVFHRHAVVVCLVLNHEPAVYRNLALHKQCHQFSSKFKGR